jgi:RIO kinase 1
MHERDGESRERRGPQRSTRAKHARGRESASPAPGGEAPTPGSLQFAAAVQVTDTERAWIREHLAPFYKNQLILDVVRRVKAGKEATVYVCSAHPSTGRSLIAAKLYRERSLRSSKNVGQYQQGRGMLDEDGHATRSRGGRTDKPVGQKSKRGQAATQTSWLMHEFTLLETLHANGADVPEPIEHGQQALLMEFVGDDLDAAPTLSDVEIDPTRAQPLFERVIFNVELLLRLGWVHGDLSAHNILYHRERIVLIDFPQVVDCQNNPRAREIFERDLERVTQYFARFGVNTDPRRLARELWSKHVPGAEHEP